MIVFDKGYICFKVKAKLKQEEEVVKQNILHNAGFSSSKVK